MATTHNGSVHPFSRVSGVAQAAVSAGVVPGLVLAVGAPALGREPRILCFGAQGEGLPLTTPGTAYDLASLSKALCTSVLAMQAVNEGRLGLETPLAQWVSQAPAGVTVEQALTHTTGWPAHRKLYEELAPEASTYSFSSAPFRDELVKRAAATPLEAEPGTRLLYSDLGFIVLGRVLEMIFDKSLAESFATRVAGPLGCPRLCFNPNPNMGPFAPTETCKWRGGLLTAQVHDQNAWIMGGVAGHAGLFGSAEDVSLLMASLLRSYAGSTQALDPIPHKTLFSFWQHRGLASGTWALGWDRPSSGFSLAGKHISRNAVGHLGFTGCSVWADPVQQLFVLTLCNRIHPEVRDDPRFRLLRPAIMDAALEDLGYVAPPASH